MKNIAFYGSHNGGIALNYNGKYKVIEFERFVNKKNVGLVQYRLCRNALDVLNGVMGYIKTNFNETLEFENCIYSNTDVIYTEKVFFENFINAKNHLHCLHHRAHAAGTFYQSPFQEALIISFDGGGSDGFFNIYTATRENSVTEIARHNIDCGYAYMIFGHYCSHINFESDINIGNLVYSGKLMGLCGYGKVRSEWVPYIKEFYYKKPDGNNIVQYLADLGPKLGLVFDTKNRFEDEVSLDLAATSQHVFEEVFFETVTPYLEKYNHLPVCVTGGCALNVILNTKLKERIKNGVFVAPNSNDCGLALGMLLDFEKPLEQVDVAYAGLPPLDQYAFYELIENKWTERYSHARAASLLRDNYIVGTIWGNSEHGPRALGNRSILVNPSAPGMKDKLNEKIKKREWFRPFAPVVRLEDVNKYFEFNDESRFMSYYAFVKPEYRDALAAVTHIDGTARLQTVTKEQNELIYDLLTAFEKQAGLGVLLNTSFNVNGKPLINSYKDALKMLDCGVDYVFTENYIVYSGNNP
jgi:carbamoyltransferase